jgi:hypothetical protein
VNIVGSPEKHRCNKASELYVNPGVLHPGVLRPFITYPKRELWRLDTP